MNDNEFDAIRFKAHLSYKKVQAELQDLCKQQRNKHLFIKSWIEGLSDEKCRSSKELSCDINDTMDTGIGTESYRDDDQRPLERQILSNKKEAMSYNSSGISDFSDESDENTDNLRSSLRERSKSKNKQRLPKTDADFRRFFLENYHKVISAQEADKKIKSEKKFVANKKRGSLNRRFHSQPSDLDSVRTEDFESKFQDMMVKQIAQVPITSFNKMMIDSDIDTVKSLIVKQKFKASAGTSQLKKDEAIHTMNGIPSTQKDNWLNNETCYINEADTSRDLSSKVLNVTSYLSGNGSHELVNNRLSRSFDLDQSFSCLMEVPVTDDKTTDDCDINFKTLQSEIKKNQLELQLAKRDKQATLHQLRSIQRILEQNRSSIRQTEHQLKDTRTKAEHARTEQVRIEFQRDTMKKEIESLDNHIIHLKQDIEILDSDGITAKFNKTQIEDILRENNEMKMLMKETVSAEEHDKLTEELGSMKKELLQQETFLKNNMEQLEKRLQELMKDLEKSNYDKEELMKTREQLESDLHSCKNEIQTINQKNEDQTSNLKTSLQDEITKIQKSLNERISILDKELQISKSTNTNLENSLKSKHEFLTSLQEEIKSLNEENEEKLNMKDDALSQLQNEMDKIIKEKDEESRILRDELQAEKSIALDTQEATLEDFYQQSLLRAENIYLKQMSELEASLMTRDAEIEMIQEKMSEQQSIISTINRNFKENAENQVKLILDSEKKKWEEERGLELKRNVIDLQHDAELKIDQLQKNLIEERYNYEQQERHLKALKKELEQHRHESRQLYREKLSALTEAKEAAQLEKEREISLYKEKVEKETLRQIDRLRETVKNQDEEIEKLKNEKTERMSKEQQFHSNIEKQEKAVLIQLNDEIRKFCKSIGMIPKKLPVPSSIGYYSTKTGSSAQNPIHTALSSSISYMKTITDEVSKIVEESRNQISNQKKMIDKLDYERQQEIENMKHKMEIEKNAAIDAIKERLIKEHIDEVNKLHKSIGSSDSNHNILKEKDLELQEIQKNMCKWKEQIADKLAKKFSEEMNKEIDKRLKEIEIKSNFPENEKCSNFLDMNYEKMNPDNVNACLTAHRRSFSGNNVSNFETPVKLSLKSSNPVRAFSRHSSPERKFSSKDDGTSYQNSSLLRKSRLTSSTSDLSKRNLLLSNPFIKKDINSNDNIYQQMEKRVQKAEDKAENHEKLLSQKQLQITNLKGSLTHQTKELMQLERAYNQLHHGSIGSSPLKVAAN